MKRFLLFRSLFFVILLIAGCSSFNNSFNSYNYRSNSNDNNAEESLKPSSSEWKNAGGVKSREEPCLYTPPTLPPTPELPLKEIIAAKQNVTQIENIERQHIDELRLFISKVRVEQSQSIAEYNKQCNRNVKP
jgi:hypothetical protein